MFTVGTQDWHAWELVPFFVLAVFGVRAILRNIRDLT